MMKKQVLIAITVLLLINIVSAIDIEVTSQPISNSYILELDKPAVFNITITNNGEDDVFEIYSLTGIQILPKSPIRINSNRTRSAVVQIILPEPLKIERGLPFPFEYKVRNSKNEIYQSSLSINIVSLDAAFSISPKSIDPDSEDMIVTVSNNLIYNFEEVKLKFDSAFTEYETEISLGPRESKEIVVPIEKDKLSKLGAGRFLLNTQFTVEGNTVNLESQVRFLEQEGIESSEEVRGSIIKTQEFTRKNVGNTRKDIEISYQRNLIAYLFTSTNINPTKKEFQGFQVNYIWEKELIPNEEYNVIITTNWVYPIIVLLLIIIIIFIIYKTIETDLQLRKNVSFVKTKGGQFALKVSLHLKSKRHLENIKVIDKLPPLVKLYDKFGAIPPDHIDTEHRRLEWNIETLNKGEARIFTYIIYSKIGVVGRFELPSANTTYEKEGKVKDTQSNRSFFINEPKSH